MASVVPLVKLPASASSSFLRESRPRPRTFAEITVCSQSSFAARLVSGRGCQASIGHDHGSVVNQRPGMLHEKDGTEPRDTEQSVETEKPGVKLALAVLRFYKGEISPYLPGSCRYIPTCSVYAQDAFKRYGVVKGTILTLWRLARCNPLGGTGFDPPRWFDEERPPQV